MAVHGGVIDVIALYRNVITGQSFSSYYSRDIVLVITLVVYCMARYVELHVLPII